MPPSEPACAYAKIALKPHTSDVQALIVRIPGVKFQKGLYIVPHHALAPFDAIMQGHQLQLHSATWASPPPETRPWEAVQQVLREGGEVREELSEEALIC